MTDQTTDMLEIMKIANRAAHGTGVVFSLTEQKGEKCLMALMSMADGNVAGSVVSKSAFDNAKHDTQKARLLINQMRGFEEFNKFAGRMTILDFPELAPNQGM